MDPAQDDLLGYLLGALEPSEQELLEARLQLDPRMRQELTRLRGQLAALDAAMPEADPPPGLAQRTCALVFAEGRRPGRPLAPDLAIEDIAPPAPLWGWTDALVAAGVFATTLLLLLPALASGRFQSQVNVCQENLRELGTALTRYSDMHEGFFPSVPTEGKLAAAGIYAPTLARSQLLDRPQRVLCPASPLAQREDFRLRELDELEEVDAEQLEELLPVLGGSYGYSLGYLDQGVYHDTQNLHRENFALLADAPSAGDPDHRSPNHGGAGSNVLFEDGHVLFVSTSRPVGADDIFTNDAGEVGVGLQPNDAVIVPSATAPVTTVADR